MKTIFITIFEGVEAKNTLRTDILKTLLDDPEVRIVFFTKSQAKVEYYKKEFNDSRLIYEVPPTSVIKGWDKFFERLKNTLLKTASTDLKRRMNYETAGNFFSYHGGRFLNWIVARPSFRKLARRLDYAFVKSDIYNTYFDKYQPNVVFLAHLFDEREIHLLRAAKRRKIPTVGFVNSWDKVTSRCIFRLLPDKVAVFNDIVKREVIKHNEMNANDILVAGIPHYDHYFPDRAHTSKEEFFKKIGVAPDKKLVVYAPLGRAFSDSDWDIIDLWYELQKQGQIDRRAELLVRFQPNDFIDEAELKKRPQLHYDYPGVRFSAQRGVDWDLSFADLRHLNDTLHYMSLLICYASSMSVDAAIFDKPVININFEINKSPSLMKSPVQYFKTEHYRNALNTGGISLVNNQAEFISWVNDYLRDPRLDAAGRKILVAEQCQFTDGHAGQRIGALILKTMRQ